ncbi:MAG: zinc ribbon domain-containing protein [Ktedonobacteraceae bacterium]
MPTYEYLCQTCSHRFETWQKMTDEPLTVCPECGNHIRRVLYPAGVVFKGSGFYKTDHANGKVAALPPGEGETKSNEGSSDSKANGEQKSGEHKSTESNGSKPASKPDNTGSSSTTSTPVTK